LGDDLKHTTALLSFFIFGAFSVLSGFSFSAAACDNFLDSTPSSKVIEKVHALDPAFEVPKNLSDEEVLLFLKEKIWSFLPEGSIPWKNTTPLSEELKQLLKERFQKSYQLEKMNEKDLSLFYANQLRSAYFLALREWMEKEVEHAAQGMELSRFQKTVGLSLISRALSPSGLLRDTLSPTLAKELLQKKEWRAFPWKEAFQVIALFPQDQKMSLMEIQNWVFENTDERVFSPTDRAQLEAALRQPSFNNPCCLTEPGCLLCPNNRFWLKHDKGS